MLVLGLVLALVLVSDLDLDPFDFLYYLDSKALFNIILTLILKKRKLGQIYRPETYRPETYLPEKPPPPPPPPEKPPPPPPENPDDEPPPELDITVDVVAIAEAV